MAENEQVRRPLREFVLPSLPIHSRCIVLPPCTSSFVIKSSFLQTLPIFLGLPSNDPYNHLEEFEEACDRIKLNGMTADALRLRLFPSSLKDRAKAWLKKLPSNSIHTWEEMQRKFLIKYFPPGLANQRRMALLTFKEDHGELFHEVWERFKDLERGSPNHGQSLEMLMTLFYQGLSSDTRRRVDNVCGGDLLDKMEGEAYKILEKLSEKSQLWDNHSQSCGTHSSQVSFKEATQPRSGGVNKIMTSSVNVQQELRKIEENMNKKFDLLLRSQGKEGLHQVQKAPSGGNFGQAHGNTCSQAHGGGSFEEGKATSGSNFGANTYPRTPFQARPYQAPLFQAPLPSHPSEAPKSNMEEMLAKILATQEQMIQSIREDVTVVTQGLHKLETQLGQLANQAREQEQGEVSSMAERNPKHSQDIDISTFASNKAYDNPVFDDLRAEKVYDNPVYFEKHVESSRAPTVPPGFETKLEAVATKSQTVGTSNAKKSMVETLSGDDGDGVILGYSNVYLESLKRKNEAKTETSAQGALRNSKEAVDTSSEKKGSQSTSKVYGIEVVHDLKSCIEDTFLETSSSKGSTCEAVAHLDSYFPSNSTHGLRALERKFYSKHPFYKRFHSMLHLPCISTFGLRIVHHDPPNHPLEQRVKNEKTNQVKEAAMSISPLLDSSPHPKTSKIMDLLTKKKTKARHANRTKKKPLVVERWASHSYYCFFGAKAYNDIKLKEEHLEVKPYLKSIPFEHSEQVVHLDDPPPHL